MVFARTMAMAANRWADARFDALNERTAGRALPAGRVRRPVMAAVAAACGAGLVLSAAGFWILHANPWPLWLAPVALVWLTGYSFAKRFTWTSHLLLGGALALSPVGAAVAIEPAYLGGPVVYLLAAMVLCWVAGFDIIYALQDEAFDRRSGLRSVPARFGAERSLWFSRGLHALAAAALVAVAWLSPPLGLGFGMAVALVIGLLVLEHALVWRARTHRLDMAFFTVNGVISLVLGGLGILDVMIAVA
jgi:4-hydroxybenzoate polyprenyltransferase